MGPGATDAEQRNVALRVARRGGRIFTGAVWGAGLVALIHLPDWSAWWHWGYILLWIGASVLALRLGRDRWRPAIVLPAAIAAFAPYAWIRASDDRDWDPEHSRPPIVTFHGDSVLIRNFRAATHRTATDFDLAWTERRLDLSALRTVDYVVEPFSAWRGLAHTFLTFGFADGTHVAISVEARRERGESYGTIKGLFRHFEVIYVIGEERDLIGLRANIRRNPVHVYPVDVPRAQIRALFEVMLRRADQLARQPEFYHSLRNTCAAAVLRHANEVRVKRLSGGWRVLFPGYSDKIAWEIGLVGFEGSLDEARAHFLINARSAFDPALDDAGWSRQIRTLAPPAAVH